MALTQTTDERTELERRASSRRIRAEDAKRAKVILMLADGTSYSTIEATLFHIGEGSGSTNSPLHSPLQRRREADSLEVRRPDTAHYW
jgi:alkaline phosphatase